MASRLGQARNSLRRSATCPNGSGRECRKTRPARYRSGDFDVAGAPHRDRRGSGVGSRIMILAADTDPWVVALPAAIAALAAIGGGYLAGWHQLKGQREDRREARAQ